MILTWSEESTNRSCGRRPHWSHRTRHRCRAPPGQSRTSPRPFGRTCILEGEEKRTEGRQVGRQWDTDVCSFITSQIGNNRFKTCRHYDTWDTMCCIVHSYTTSTHVSYLSCSTRLRTEWRWTWPGRHTYSSSSTSLLSLRCLLLHMHRAWSQSQRPLCCHSFSQHLSIPKTAGKHIIYMMVNNNIINFFNFINKLKS